ncbi:hypothetical protein L6164_034977 [Bauhinia variegata]|uniref:Uncharacterized protein n=1 Tax=Bauhinia variegata TaxID=167791 RepID=A0ACB9KWR4_BAUVA|nr:hypothetical protein L6164_034977 [Bauhinia variegata]
MASRNRTLLYRKYRDALKSVRAPSSSSASTTSTGAGGPVIELVSTSLLNPNRSYTPLSTEDPGNSRCPLFSCMQIISILLYYIWIKCGSTQIEIVSACQ